MPDRKKVFLVVGGTGGHIYPGISLAESLHKKDPDLKIEFVIDKKPLAVKELSDRGFIYHKVCSAAFPRKKIIFLCHFLCCVARGIVESLWLLRKKPPVCVIGFGAYFSVPMLLAAAIRKIPVVIHEQNLDPGLANKLLTVIASKIAVSFKNSIQYFPPAKTVFTGNPVRKELLGISRQDALKFFELEENKFNIFVFGGSLGSESINVAIQGILPYLEGLNGKLQFVHICGKQAFQDIIDTYASYGYLARVYPYLPEIAYAYSMADLVVCRAGASTVSELAALAKPAILIPYPGATSQHQLHNAEFFGKSGASICYPEDKLSGEGLAVRMMPLIKDKNKLHEMSIKIRSIGEKFMHASDILADIVLEDYVNIKK